MNKSVLTICKPSYNRKNVIIPDILDYLSVKDERLRIKVNDNCSTDGSVDEFIKIEDSRFSFRVNEANIGPMPNGIASLKGCESEYILFVIDKDTVDINVLPLFIDYLETEKPNFGYVDLSNNKPKHIETFSRGYDAITHIGYLSKHPSGFFWKTVLFEEVIQQDSFKELNPSFDFPYDVICGTLGAKYDGVIVFMPLIINSLLRQKLVGNKSYSYSDDNLYFGARKRLEAYELYLKQISNLDLDNKTKEEIQFFVTRRNAEFVTTTLRLLLQHTDVCDHYNLTPRVVPLNEMIGNLKSLLEIYGKYAPSYLKGLALVYKKSFVFVRYTLSSFKMCVKELLHGFKQPTLVNA